MEKKKERKKGEKSVAGFFSKRSSPTPTRGEFRAYVSCQGGLGPLCAPKRISCRISRAFSSGYPDNGDGNEIPRDSKWSRLHANSRKLSHTYIYIYGKLSHPWPETSEQFSRIGQKITWRITQEVINFFKKKLWTIQMHSKIKFILSII